MYNIFPDDEDAQQEPTYGYWIFINGCCADGEETGFESADDARQSVLELVEGYGFHGYEDEHIVWDDDTRMRGTIRSETREEDLMYPILYRVNIEEDEYR